MGSDVLATKNEPERMNLSTKAQEIYAQISEEGTKLGDLRKLAKEIKKDHELAMELWTTGGLYPRQLAILIMDKKLLTKELINQLCEDMAQHDDDGRNQLADWLMANQLAKDKKTIALMESWQNSDLSIQRRLFWYHQARLRWMGQTPPDNTEDLLAAIEKDIEKEAPEVQWAMNFTAGWMGVFDTDNRPRCIALGERTGLYKDEMVARGCTPSYLPAFIEIEAGKREVQ